MEKVYIIFCDDFYNIHVDNLNRDLANGWKVKSITTNGKGNQTVVVIVIEQ